MLRMELLEWVGLGYAALLVPATLAAASLCRIAKLSGRYDEHHQREVLIWGSLPIRGEIAERDGWTTPGIVSHGLAGYAPPARNAHELP